jgi:hypothetical protein
VVKLLEQRPRFVCGEERDELLGRRGKGEEEEEEEEVGYW